MSSNRRRILIVDDSPEDREYLKLLLKKATDYDWQFTEASSGVQGLAVAVSTGPFECVLLDYRLRDIDGMEFLELLRIQLGESAMAIIVLTGEGDEAIAVRAMKLGALDYLSKASLNSEVLCRAVEYSISRFRLILANQQSAKALAELQRALQRQNEQLEEAVAARTLELSEANKRLSVLDRSKSDFLSLISHELRTPLNGLLGAAEMVLEELPVSLQNEPIRGLYARARRRILSILDDALLLGEIDASGMSFKSGPVFLSEALSRAIAGTAEFAKARLVTITPPLATRDLVIADEDLLVRALQALLETAIKFSEKGSGVMLSFDPAHEFRTVTIESHGSQVAASDLAKFFEIFALAGPITARGDDLGLAAPLAYRIVSLFGGSVSVANRNHPAGVRLTVSLKGGTPNGSDSRQMETHVVS